MNDLISRQAAIDAIEDLDWYHQNKNKDMVLGANSDEHQAWYKADDIYKTLDVLPSAQTERKKGKWIVKDNPGTGWYRVTCSECGEDVTSVIPMIGFPPNAKALWDFCPDCGARMEEDNG